MCRRWGLSWPGLQVPTDITTCSFSLSLRVRRWGKVHVSTSVFCYVQAFGGGLWGRGVSPLLPFFLCIYLHPLRHHQHDSRNSVTTEAVLRPGHSCDMEPARSEVLMSCLQEKIKFHNRELWGMISAVARGQGRLLEEIWREHAIARPAYTEALAGAPPNLPLHVRGFAQEQGHSSTSKMRGVGAPVLDAFRALEPWEGLTSPPA